MLAWRRNLLRCPWRTEVPVFLSSASSSTPSPPWFFMASWRLDLEEPVFRTELRVLEFFPLWPGPFHLLTSAGVGPWQAGELITADAEEKFAGSLSWRFKHVVYIPGDIRAFFSSFQLTVVEWGAGTSIFQGILKLITEEIHSICSDNYTLDYWLI